MMIAEGDSLNIWIERKPFNKSKFLDHIEFLKEKELKHRSAYKQAKTKCIRCGYCCLKSTCIPEPEDIPRIAEYLGVRIKELVTSFLIVDYVYSLKLSLVDQVNFEKKPLFLRPIKETQSDLAGKLLPSERLYDRGYCIFYDKIKRICTIWPVRPKEARYYNCWTKKKDFNAIESWKENIILRFVNKDILDP